MKKQTQDLLQAELCNTLKRRKPVVIDEPPKYQYPTYNESKNSSNESSSSSKIDNESIKTSTVKPANVNAVLSVVTGIKIPDVQYDINVTKTKFDTLPKSTNDTKPKISHGKPNFVINRNDSASKLIKQIENGKSTATENKIVQLPKFGARTETIEVKSVLKPKFQTQPSIEKTVKFINKENSTHQNATATTTTAAIIPRKDSDVLKSYGEVSSTLKKIEAMKSKPIEKPQHEKTLAPVTNIVANKKALFEQSADLTKQPSPVPQIKQKPFVTKTISNDETKLTNGSSGKIFDIHRSLNRTTSNGIHQRTAVPTAVNLNQRSFAVNTNVINKSDSSSPIKPFMKSPTTTTTTATKTKDEIDHNTITSYRKQPSSLYSTKTYETKNFEQKTIVSFSKDLHNAPNHHPEQVRVMRTIITQTHTTNTGTNGSLNNFRDIRFSIGPNAQVVPKPK